MSIPIWVTDPAGNNNPFLKIKSPFFIGVGHAAAVATWSQSGSPWIPLASPPPFIPVRIVSGNGLYVVVGFDDFFTYTGVSADKGATWTNVAHQELNDSSIYALGYGNGVFVLGGQNKSGNTYTPFMFTSTDGVNWTSRSPGFPVITTNGGSGASNPSDVVYGGNGFWVACGLAVKTPGSSFSTDYIINFAYSTDNGASWQASPTTVPPLSASTSLGALAYALGTFIYSGLDSLNGARIFQSFDGVHWTENTNHPTTAIGASGFSSVAIGFDSNGVAFAATGGTVAGGHAFIWTAEMIQISQGVYSAVTWTNNTVLPAAMSAVVTLRNAGEAGGTYFASMSAVSDGVFHLASSSDGVTYSTVASTDGIYDIASGLF